MTAPPWDRAGSPRPAAPWPARQAVYLLDVGTAGRVRLLRATITDVWGDGPDPADWWYRLTVTGPRSTNTVTAPAASVVHVRYATEAHSPARGVSPLQYAALTGTLTANLEQSLGFEAGGAVANLITLPAGFNGQPPTATGGDGEPLPQDDPLPSDNLAEVIRTAKGRTLLPETTADNWNGDPNARPPRRDFEPQRLGADPPQALIQLRRHVEDSVLACFGVPSPLGPGGLTDGTAAREGARRLWTMTIQPLGAVIAEELSRVLERPVTSRVRPAVRYGGPCGSSARRRRPGESWRIHRRRNAAHGMGRCLTPWRSWPTIAVQQSKRTAAPPNCTRISKLTIPTRWR